MIQKAGGVKITPAFTFKNILKEKINMARKKVEDEAFEGIMIDDTPQVETKSEYVTY